MSNVILKDNTAEVKGLILTALENALEKCGMVCESYAKSNAPVDTGALRNSINHRVAEGERAVYIGSNLEYAPYVELGTGIYATQGGGRTDAWSFEDSSGNWHKTNGSRPQPFLKPALEEHASEYRAILEAELKNG